MALTGSLLPEQHQSRIGGNVLRVLRQLVPAQRRKRVAGEDDTLPAPLDQCLFGQEISALA